MAGPAAVVGREVAAAAAHQSKITAHQVIEVGQRRVGGGRSSRAHVGVGGEPRRLPQVDPAEGHDHDGDDQDEGDRAACDGRRGGGGGW